jgi:hypothetical protein
MDNREGADREATVDRDQVGESPQVVEEGGSRDGASHGRPEGPSEDGFIPLEHLKKIADGEAPWPERQR